MKWFAVCFAVLSLSLVGCSKKSTPTAAPAAKSDTYTHQAISGGGTSTGGVCKGNDIENVMTKYGKNLRNCFTAQVPNNPNFGGRVTLNFTIQTNGKVGNVSTSESTINHGGVEKCLKDVVAPAQFAKPNGGTCNVRWPLSFGN